MNEMKKKSGKSGNMIPGVIAGIILPAICFLVILLVKRNDDPLLKYLSVVHSFGIIPKLISLCLLPNLILFFYFIRLNRLKNARGVIFAMFIYGILILITKFAGP